MKKIWISGLLLLSCLTGAMSADNHRQALEKTPEVRVYVAPDGIDTNPGTKAKPFETLERARDAARALGENRKEKVVVLLAPGTYPRTATFELDARDSNTIYRTDPSGKPGSEQQARIFGGVEIPASTAKPVTNTTLLNRVVEKSARSHLLQINLKALGITDYGTLGPRGFRRAYIPAPLELFIDNKAQQIARWPNAGEHHIPLGKVLQKGSIPRTGDYSFRAGTFEYGVKRPQAWTQARDFYVSGLFSRSFADDTIHVANLDTAAGTFTTAHPHMYGFIKQPYCSWYALNLLEEIDLPGEYYVDSKSGILYFYPPAGFSSSSKLSVSLMKEVMVAIEGASDIRFENIVFEITRGSGIYIERGSDNTIAGCTLRNMGILAVQIGMGIEPFPYGKHDGCGNKVDGTPGKIVSRQMGSWHEYIYKYTAWDRKAGTNQKIISCNIYDTGAGGISLGGGDRKTLTPANNAVINCDIYRVNRWGRTYKAPVNIDGAGNRVVNCHLHDVPGIGVYLHGNNHQIAYNEFNHVLTDMSDMGAIYMGRDPSESGNHFNYNFFHHIKNFHTGGHGVQAIFFDDKSVTGAEMIGNVFFRAGSSSVIKFNGGGACDIKNNIFADCVKPLGQTKNSTEKVRKWMAGELGQDRLRQQVDITTPPYSTQYPRLLSIYNHAEPVVTTPEHNYIVNGDLSPFVDADQLNFNLKSTSSVYREIPEFSPIPFDKIGLYKDIWRKEIPAGTNHTSLD